jgi:peptidoglycan hydrolase-like protein with peptidoglycan-binding domain
VTGFYGDQTVAVVEAAQAQRGVTGPDANGQTIGPRTKAAFAAFGLRW